MSTPFRVFRPLFENDFGTDNRAFVPEVWAQESLMVLEQNLVYANLVHRDFNSEIAAYGDVVNTRRPGKFTAKFKKTGDAIVQQQATAEKVQVRLDRWAHTSFMIYDDEQTKSMKDLFATYLQPAVHSLARQIDSMIDGEKYQFITNTVGKLGTAPGKSAVIGVKAKLDDQLVPAEGRVCIIPTSIDEDLLNVDQFTDADKFGDGGTAIRQGSIGMLYGTNYIHSTNNREVTACTDVVTGAINNASGHAAGATSITVDGFSAAITTGSWITVAGDMTPQLVTGTTGGATPTAIAISPGLRAAVVNDAVVTVYTPGAVNLSAGYAQYWPNQLVIDGFTTDGPKIGQMVSKWASAKTAATIDKYSALDLGKDSSGTDINRTLNLALNRSLDNAAANGAVLGVGPAGNFGFAFHRNAVSLVNRPLALPPPGSGARAAVVSYNDLSLRVTMTYDGTYQGTLVTVDGLFGVKTLDTALGCVLLG